MARAPSRYRSRRFWSAELGCDAARVSMHDEHGGEHFAIIPMNMGGRSNRERTQLAIETLSQHIIDERDPGRVIVAEPQPEATHG